MIVVAGEALMDVLVDEVGRLEAVPGGASFNVARFLAELGGDCCFLGRLSEDPFGAELALELQRAGVTLANPEPLREPTTLSMVQLDSSGSADYRFYGDGTAAALLTAADVPPGLLVGARALAVGGLGITFEPVRTTLLDLVDAAPPETLVVVDPNCRPHAVGDRARYLRAVEALAERADILKVSREDLSYLWPGREPVESGTALLTRGTGVVFITDGPHPVTVLTAEGSCSVAVPAVDVVDTIGAGDGFLAALLLWCAGRPQIDPRTAGLSSMREAATSAADVAGAVCTLRGAALPNSFVRPRSSDGAGSDQQAPNMLGVRSSGVVVRPSSGRPTRRRQSA
jgi:fructokinase